MQESDVIQMVQEALIVAIKIASPMLLVSMAVGLAISIIQTTTSIQEQTLTFVPKVVAVFFAIAVFATYILHTVVDYTRSVYDLIRLF